LDEVSEISKNLASESKKYNWGAKQLSVMVSKPIPLYFVVDGYMHFLQNIARSYTAWNLLMTVSDRLYASFLLLIL